MLGESPREAQHLQPVHLQHEASVWAKWLNNKTWRKLQGAVYPNWEGSIWEAQDLNEGLPHTLKEAIDTASHAAHIQCLHLTQANEAS